MHEGFVNMAYTLRNENLLRTEAFFVRQKDVWFKDFAGNFRNMCTEILNMQEAGTLSPISYIEYTILNTNIVNRRYVAEVRVYGERSYLDENQRAIGEYNVSFLFSNFDKLWNDLLSARKRFVGQVKAQEITAFMLESLPEFFSYLTNTARFAIKEFINEKLFTDIAKNDVFMVSVGDYMAKTEPVYTECKKKNARELVDWFSDKLNNVYVFGDYSNLDFSNQKFQNMDFRYAQFNGCVLNNVSFEGSTLIGASFRGAQMEGCSLDGCCIQEADFSNAKLMNASFFDVNAGIGLTSEKSWEFVGFLPVSFRGADLTGAGFANSDLTGADFTGAVMYDANFTGAILT